MAGQSVMGSVCECVLNTVIGYATAIAAQLLIFPLFDIHISLAENFVMSAMFTVVGLVRSFAIRRLFNWIGFGRHARNKHGTT